MPIGPALLLARREVARLAPARPAEALRVVLRFAVFFVVALAVVLLAAFFAFAMMRVPFGR
ncbi:hypothetical protein [Pseudorhodoplanes sinuspersici]|uniref:Uncharacterized protein n=1 Tax=Pseudorhodoplanes sinuspersici TaxID=1235591 RepID=A0A1W6ZXM0_9HYPH|nr:hypothetical protein [Pseudorhodoplanes sinuspersici]ARQ01505.1 hypothetical protein CAK95_22145 [Pseudorhodoplanes sinuspersici]